MQRSNDPRIRKQGNTRETPQVGGEGEAKSRTKGGGNEAQVWRGSEEGNKGKQWRERITVKRKVEHEVMVGQGRCEMGKGKEKAYL